MRTNLFTRLAPVAAVAMFAATASAQDIVSNGVSVAGEKNNHGVASKQDSRAAIFTQSAFVAPKGAFGVGIQAVGQRASDDGVSATGSLMAVSAYYGVTDRVSVGAYVPSTGAWFLRNTNAPGGADVVFSYGPTNVTPLVGNWDGL